MLDVSEVHSPEGILLLASLSVAAAATTAHHYALNSPAVVSCTYDLHRAHFP